jgi:hypothetical protein
LKAIFNDYWSFYCSHASLTGRDMFWEMCHRKCCHFANNIKCYINLDDRAYYIPGSMVQPIAPRLKAVQYLLNTVGNCNSMVNICGSTHT